MGGIGALLLAISPFAAPYTTILGIIGLVLGLVAFNDLANIYKDRSMFNNAIYAGIAAIVGTVVSIVIVVASAFGILSVLGIKWTWTNWSAVQNYNWNGFTDWNKIAPYVAAIVGALVILVVCFIIAGFLFRRSLNNLSEKSGTHLFATAGLLFLIGAILTIIGIGAVLIWIALIVLAIAFFQMKTEPTQPQATPPPS